MHHFSYPSLLTPYASDINSSLNETKINTLLPKNVAMIRALAAMAFTTLSTSQLSNTVFYWPVFIVGAAFSGWTIYSMSKDPIIEPFYQILGGRNDFEQLPEINLVQNPNEKIADAIKKIDWESLEERIYRSNTLDGQPVVLIKDFKDHKMQGVLAFIKKVGPSVPSHKPDLPFEVVFHSLSENNFSKMLEYPVEVKNEDHLENDASFDKAKDKDMSGLIADMIKNCQNFQEIITFVEKDLIIDGQPACLNSENWAQWFNLLVQFSTKPLNREKVEKIIQKMRIQIPHCSPNQYSQIAKAAEKLGIVSESLADWIFENSMNSLSSINAQKFYMMIWGARQLLKASNLRTILTSYSHILAGDQIKQDSFLAELSPKGMTCILKAHAKIGLVCHLSDLLLEQAIIRLETTFDLQSKIDLIAGLSFYAYKNSDIVNLLSKIESDLASRDDLPLASLRIAMSHFAVCGFVPSQILSKVKICLENLETSIWDRISLLYPLAILGIKEDFSPSFDQLIQLMDKLNQENQKIFKKIYHQDLIRFLYVAVAFSPERSKPHPVIADIVNHLLKFKLSFLTQKDRYRLIAPLLALGYVEKGEELSKGVDHFTLSKAQIEVRDGIKTYLNEKISSKKVSIKTKSSVKGIKADVLIISSNEKRRGYPIVIELDGPPYWACNKPDHPLGQSKLRSLALKQVGCEWKSFNLRDGIPEVIEQVIAYLQTKNL